MTAPKRHTCVCTCQAYEGHCACWWHGKIAGERAPGACRYCGSIRLPIHEIVTRADGISTPCSGGDVEFLRNLLAHATDTLHGIAMAHKARQTLKADPSVIAHLRWDLDDKAWDDERIQREAIDTWERIAKALAGGRN